MYKSLLTRYQRVDDKSRVLLIYLILNGYDMEMVEKIIITDNELQFGSRVQRSIGVTPEYVDVERINEELQKIQVPIIYSPQSFNLYAKAETIYCYRAKEESKRLYINDMGVISSSMVITPECIISSNLAASIESTDNKGFMYFADYVLNGECIIGQWSISFKDNHFCVYYSSTYEDKESKELLYEGFELDQTSTFKLVIYIIQKVAGELDDITSDNYAVDVLKLKESK